MKKNQTILIVDDTKINLDILIEIGVPVDKVDELRPLVIEFIDNLDNLKGAL